MEPTESLGGARKSAHLRARGRHGGTLPGARLRVCGELLGGVRVHFVPYQAQATVPQSLEPLEGTVTSRNGFLSDKDSGSMFYVIRLT
ncbi:MAG: hypothetical protein ACREX4_11250 [Gammaproteobacteria bacterium]